MSVKITPEQRVVLLETLSNCLANSNMRAVMKETGVSYPVLFDMRHKNRTKFYADSIVRVANHFGIHVL